jgi:hypothetical protein
MIKKPTIIITSLGRTGTAFFALLFDHLISDGTSIHEPDILTAGQGVRGIIKQLWEVGAYYAIFKVLGQRSLVRLSDARLTGEISYADAAQNVLRQRQRFVRSRKGQVYIESSLGYYGLIDVLKETYRYHRVAYIIRDGRSWVRSFMNQGTDMLAPMYAKGRLISKIVHTWPTALEFEDDAYRSKWLDMSRFERLCWAWGKLNTYAMGTLVENPDARLFRFEDIFISKNRYKHLAELVEFATAFPQFGPLTDHTIEGSLDRQVNPSVSRFPEWNQWSTEQKQHFQATCGSLMESLGYQLD